MGEYRKGLERGRMIIWRDGWPVLVRQPTNKYCRMIMGNAIPESPKFTAEQTLTLDVHELQSRGVLAPGSRTRGVISWTGAFDEVVASISYAADMADTTTAWLRLRFATTSAEGSRTQVDQRVPLAATRPGFGGMRWWFVESGRRVAKLHMPSGGRVFTAKSPS